jgi:hypothetical protein
MILKDKNLNKNLMKILRTLWIIENKKNPHEKMCLMTLNLKSSGKSRV